MVEISQYGSGEGSGRVTSRPTLQAEATLLIERVRPTVAPYVDFKEPGRSEADYQTQYEILKSRKLARRVIDALELRTHPEFVGQEDESFSIIDTLKGWAGLLLQALRTAVPSTSTPDGATAGPRADPDPDAQLINRLLNRLDIDAEPKVHLVEVRFLAHDNGLAANVVNTLARLYIEFQMEMRFATLRNALSWLRQQVQDIGQKVAVSEHSLQQYKNDHEVYSIKERQPGLMQKISELETGLTEVKTQRVELEMVYDEAQQAASRGRDVEGVSAVSENRLIQELKSVQVGLLRTYTELRQTYSDRHPRVRRIKSQMDAVSNKIEWEADQIIQGKLLQYRVAKAREAVLLEQLQTLWAEVKDLNKKAVQYGVLEREAESNRRLEDVLLKRLKEASASMSRDLSGGSNIQIIDAAEVPAHPINYKPQRAMGLGGVMGLVIGLCLVAFIGYVDRTVKTPEEAEALLGLPVVGIIERFRFKPHTAGRSGGRLVTVDAMHSRATEAFKTLRANVFFNSTESPDRVFLVTSPHPQDGKSTVAANLAVVMAQTERRVLLVDADLRHPVMHKVFDVDNRTGLSELLLTETYDEILELCGDAAFYDDGLAIIPAGETPANPSELLESTRMRRFLERARERYDIIIIDSPPTLAVSDAMVLSAWVDSVLFVLRANTSSRDHARRAAASLLAPLAESLAEGGPGETRHRPERSLGVVMNDVDPQDHGTPRSGAYQRYYGS